MLNLRTLILGLPRTCPQTGLQNEPKYSEKPSEFGTVNWTPYKYVQGKDTKDAHRWTHLSSTPQVMSWQGFSFELLCLLHLDEIKKSLGIDRILNDASAWRSKQTEQNTQIDLVIERADRNINLCEMKFSTAMYAIDKDYEQKLRERMSIFQAETKTRCSTRITMVTTYGVLKNKHSGIVDDEVQLEDLFAETDETR